MGLQQSQSSIKKTFFQIVIFGSLIPLCISFLFLFYVIKINKDKLEAYNANQSKVIELSIQNLFYRAKDSLDKIGSSQEIKNFFNSSLKNQSSANKQFKKFLLREKRIFNQLDINYCIYGSHGSFLYSEANCPTQQALLNNNSSYLKNENIYAFYIPYFYNSLSGKHQVTIAAVIPFSSLKKQYGLLESVEVSKDLSQIKVKVNLGLESFDRKIAFIFYITILICTLLSIFSILYGVRIAYRLKTSAEDSLKLAAIGKIAHLLAHDIKKPFENISYFTQQLSVHKDKEEIEKLIIETKNSIESSQVFIQNLLSELMDASTQTLHLENNLSIKELLNECFSACPKNLMEHISIQTNLHHTLQLNADKTKINRAFFNIIANAINAIKDIPNSKITVSSMDHGNNIRIVFHNSNSFIPKSELSKIFDPFYTKRTTGGTGLGLAITRKMIELHNGSIYCTSDKKSGVSFIIDLPGAKGSHVFIIDDCPLALRAWTRHLKGGALAQNVHSFLNFDEFFQFIQKNQIKKDDINTIICDYQIPNSSMEITDAIKKIRKFYTKPIYIATHMDKTVVENHLKNLNVIVIGKSNPEGKF